MRLCAALDLMGLQAVRQGQITNNWLKQGPDYWLRKIEDKQLFLCLPRHSTPPAPPQPPWPQTYCGDSTVPLMINGSDSRPFVARAAPFSLCRCSITAFQKIYLTFFFFFSVGPPAVLKQAWFTPADFDKRSVWICEHQHVFETEGNHSYQYHFHFTT